jgi:hypothetical protein
MREEICEAIVKKRLIQFSYESRIRVVEPHLLGRDSAGHDALCSYLVRGYTESDHRPYWRLYLLSKIKYLTVLDETFLEPRRGYNPRDKRMTKIYCRLNPI